MPKEKFVLVSLQEDKAKKLAQVITNDSCRRILDYLADNEATESELANKLDLPISTVHYNLKQLVEGGLVIAEEFHYSKKGKEVLHYKLANKYIIIAPKSTYGIKEKLKAVLPVVLLLAVGAGILQIFSKGIRSSQVFTTVTKTFGGMTEKATIAQDLAKTAAEAAPAAVEEVAEVMPAFQNVTTSTSVIPASPLANIALWFLIGGLFALIVYLIINAIMKKEK